MSDEAAEADLFLGGAARGDLGAVASGGESMSSIGRRFDRESSSVFSVLSPSGGIRPAERRRSVRSLSLAEREEVSRGLVAGRSIRAIAGQLGRAPSTISREVGRNGGRDRYRATRLGLSEVVGVGKSHKQEIADAATCDPYAAF